MLSLRKSLCELKRRRGVALKKYKHPTWLHITWSQYAQRVEQIAYSLLSMGIEKGDCIAIFSHPRPKWCFTDSATTSIGAISVPIYTSISNEDLIYILNKTQTSVLFCENTNQLKQWKEIRKQCPKVQKIICFEDCWDKDISPLRWDLFLTLGDELYQKESALWIQLCESLNDEDIATIVFTSGTTGLPKSVPITHQQIDHELQAVFSSLIVSEKDVSLSILPYAHILGRLELWGHICLGYSIAFTSQSDDIEKRIHEINPSFIITVPRVLEKFLANINTRIASNPIKKYLFQQAQNYLSQIETRKKEFKPIKMKEILLKRGLQKYVFQESHRLFGKKLRFIISGGAPLNTDIAQLFLSSGILVLEGYGLTECTGAVTLNTPSSFEFGTVGKPLPGVQIRIAEDGEILIKSPTVMTGYLNESPVQKWLPTGDIGHFNDHGFLVISDRKKELIKTSAGKYISPAKLTRKLLKNPIFSHVHIHGDQKNYAVALVTLNKNKLLTWAKQNDLSYANLGDLTQHSQTKQMVRSLIAETNKKLASFETIKNFKILREDFSIETGELTSSLKVKRKFCDEKFSEIINSLYILESQNDLETPTPK